MPTVKRPAALLAAYQATKNKINDLPSLMLQGNQVIYRSMPAIYLPTREPDGHISKSEANKLLIPRDGAKEGNNRFSGPSQNATIPPIGAIYCVLQQQALVNENTHYSGRAAAWALYGKAVLRMNLMGSLLVAELTPHNPHAMRFLKSIGPKTWDEMNDPDDCSVARGIALAIAETRIYRGIAVQTVRESERSDEERGDNVVLFANPGQPVPTLSIREIWLYGKARTPEIIPVTVP